MIETPLLVTREVTTLLKLSAIKHKILILMMDWNREGVRGRGRKEWKLGGRGGGGGEGAGDGGGGASLTLQAFCKARISFPLVLSHMNP